MRWVNVIFSPTFWLLSRSCNGCGNTSQIWNFVLKRCMNDTYQYCQQNNEMKSAKNADLMVFATKTYFPVFDFLRETEKNYKKKLCPHHYIHSEADEFLVLPITYFIFLCLFYFFPFHQKKRKDCFVDLYKRLKVIS